MLNETEIIYQSRTLLVSLLKSIPFINGVELNDGSRADFIATMYVDNNEKRLVCEVKKNFQPRFVLDAVRQVKEHSSYFNGETGYPVIVSEYISPRSAEILIDNEVSYFDLSGNCRLCFSNVYIEKAGGKSKSAESRGVKSLFGLKSSRMLRLMLRNPIRPWQVKELAANTELSLGQVSNIRRALLNQQYAVEAEKGGIQLSQPAALLGDWAKSYKKNIVNKRRGFYSLLNPDERVDAIRAAMSELVNKRAEIILSGLSAARWQAPFAKSLSETFYANNDGIEILKKHLMLEPASIGPNVFIEEPKDSYIFKEATACAPGLKCTSAIHTYLDLYITGEREREAAEHIKSIVLEERWSNQNKDEI